jgi:TIR domain
VFFIIEMSLINENNGGLHGLLLVVKKTLSDDGGPRKFQSHLAGPWAHWSPRPLSTFDVLLSASAADDTVAVDIEARLVAAGLSTVRSIRPAGDFGDETLRRQLLECQVLLSVLTPSSVHDPRVAIETGACWVLAKPFVPVLSNIIKTELPPSMAARQCVEVGDAAALGRLPQQVKLLVLGR